MGRVNHGPKTVVGLIDDHQKNLSPYLAFLGSQEKIIKKAKLVKITKKHDFPLFQR